MLTDLTATHWLSLHGLVTSLAVLACVIGAHVMRRRRQPTAAVAGIPAVNGVRHG